MHRCLQALLAAPLRWTRLRCLQVACRRSRRPQQQTLLLRSCRQIRLHCQCSRSLQPVVQRPAHNLLPRLIRLRRWLRLPLPAAALWVLLRPLLSPPLQRLSHLTD